MLLHPPAGDKKSGCVRVLYDTTWSTRGVVQTVGRKPRGKNLFDFQVSWVLCSSGATYLGSAFVMPAAGLCHIVHMSAVLQKR